MRRSKSRRQINAEINVTSLLDIVFVLLIAFMIVAPALKHGVELELPKVKHAPAYKDTLKPVEVRVLWKTGAGGEMVTVNGRECSAEEAVDQVKAKLLASSNLPVTLEADRRVPWEFMAGFITSLRAAGVEQLGIISLKRQD